MAVAMKRNVVAPERLGAKPVEEWESRVDNSPLARVLFSIGVFSPVLAVLVAIVHLWQRTMYLEDVALLLGMYFVVTMGVTIGYHRYLTHRGFRAPTWLKFLLLVLGSMSMQGPALIWASTHLEHHAKADKEGDPHSPLQGLIHAHLGWIIQGFDANPDKYGPWLKEDAIVRFVSKTYWLWVLVSLAIPYAVGGWHGLLWGGLVRIFLMHHVTWSVNSACHTFGKRPFKTGDRSTNHWLVGLLASGEGWHNNHHAFQRSAYHGLFWWQLDLSGIIIRLLELAHLITDVQRVAPVLLAKRRRETVHAE